MIVYFMGVGNALQPVDTEIRNDAMQPIDMEIGNEALFESSADALQPVEMEIGNDDAFEDIGDALQASEDNSSAFCSSAMQIGNEAFSVNSAISFRPIEGDSFTRRPINIASPQNHTRYVSSIHHTRMPPKRK